MVKLRSWLTGLIVGVPAVVLCVPSCATAADANRLWTIVHDECVPNMEQNGKPWPCVLVDLQGGVEQGYVVLKDNVGTSQYLLIPTDQVTGIESSSLIESKSPNYFAAAWRQRGYTERAVRSILPQGTISLAVNSARGRTQNQLHIHIDCIRPDVREALRRQQTTVDDHWRPLAEALLGHRYRAMRVPAEGLETVNPFILLANRISDSDAKMSEQTLVVVDADFDDGPTGFIILNGHVDLTLNDNAQGEELQDHECVLANP
jgi:CDP-diacylglycerol pyrophosphatase